MTDKKPPAESKDTATPKAETTAQKLRYANGSGLQQQDDGANLRLSSNVERPDVACEVTVKEPLRLRELLGCLHGVVSSDFRYVPKDRSAYMAYRQMRKNTAALEGWKAQQAYFDWLQRNDPMAWLMLDPVVSVHPDGILMEVFSKDEASYACLQLKPSAFKSYKPAQCGTTNIDFSDELAAGIKQMRSYKQTTLSIGQQQVAVQNDDEAPVIEKNIEVPNSWLRGFLQVQSAASLPMEQCKLNPIDLYNALRELRMHADRTRERRGLRIELLPSQAPVMVLEPWETVIEGQAEPYQGKQAKIVRLWGRRRLSLLASLLPLCDDITVHLLGSGLPSFWVLEGADFRFTFGLTGFTSANWSSAINFDLLLPRQNLGEVEVEKISAHLQEVWAASSAQIGKATGLKGDELQRGLQAMCLQGLATYDLSKKQYRYRPISAQPLPLEAMEFRSPQERLAHDLLQRKDGVSISSENHIVGTGVELVGKIQVTEDKREYRSAFLLDDEGKVGKADCSCHQFRQQGLKAGPCAHLLALRLAYAQRLARQAKRSRNTVTVETRVLSKRADGHEQVYQLSLDQQKLKMRWGRNGQKLRLQQMRFNSVADARTAYYERLDALSQQGYLDANAA